LVGGGWWWWLVVVVVVVVVTPESRVEQGCEREIITKTGIENGSHSGFGWGYTWAVVLSRYEKPNFGSEENKT
jgi:hypothetical protein